MFGEQPADGVLVGVDVGEPANGAVGRSVDDSGQAGLGYHLLDFETGSDEYESLGLARLHDAAGEFVDIVGLAARRHEIEGDVEAGQFGLEPHDHAVGEESFGAHVALVNHQVDAGDGRFALFAVGLSDEGSASLAAIKSPVAGEVLERPVGDSRANPKHAGGLRGGQVGIAGVQAALADVAFDLSGELDDSGDVLVLGCPWLPF